MSSVDHPYETYFSDMCKLADEIIAAQVANGEDPVKPADTHKAWLILLRFRPYYGVGPGFFANQLTWSSAYGFAYIKWSVRNNMEHDK